MSAPPPKDGAVDGSPEPADTRSAGFVGGNRVGLLQGGDELFPAMQRAMAAARLQVWIATYIFHDDAAGQAIGQDVIGGYINQVRRGIGCNRRKRGWSGGGLGCSAESGSESVSAVGEGVGRAR